MRIINTKSPSVRGMLTYNESKTDQMLEDGTVAAKKLISNMPEAGATFSSYLTGLNSRSSLNKGRAKNKFIHLKIAFHEKDNPSDLTMATIAMKTLNHLDLGGNPYVVYRHYDRMHPHLHIVATRVKSNGRVASDSFDGLKQRALAIQLEEEFNLVRAEDQRISHGLRKEDYLESKDRIRSSEVTPNQYIRESVLGIIQDKPPLKVFIRRLRRRGIEVRLKEFKTRQGSEKVGISYRLIGSSEEASFFIESEIEPTPLQFNIPRIKSFYQSGEETELTIGRWPNGMPCVHLSDTPPPTSFRAYAIRASRLGPTFMYDGLRNHISGLDDEDLSQLPGLKKRHNNEIDVNSQFNENPVQRKLMVCLELGSYSGAMEALKQGALMDEVDSDELKFFDKRLVEKVKKESQDLNIEQGEVNKLYFEFLSDRHSNTYQFLNPKTKKFLLEIADGDYSKAEKTIKSDLKTYSGVDTRSFALESKSNFPESLIMAINDRSLKWDVAAENNDYLLSKAEYAKKKLVNQFYASINQRDHGLLRNVLKDSLASRALVEHFKNYDLPTDVAWVKDRNLKAGLRKLAVLVNKGGRVEDSDLLEIIKRSNDVSQGNLGI